MVIDYKFPIHKNFFNPQAVGVPYSLRYFLEGILQPGNLKNVTSVSFRSLATIFDYEFDHKYCIRKSLLWIFTKDYENYHSFSSEMIKDKQACG